MENISTHENPRSLGAHARLIESYLTIYCAYDTTLSAGPFIANYPEEFIQEFCPEAKNLPAAFIINESTDCTFLGIHVRADLLLRLMETDDLKSLLSTRVGLNSFLTLTEEISHFHQYVLSGLEGRKVSRFDLELQAELDKLIVSYLVFHDIFGHPHVHELTRLLFDESTIHGTLTDYADASRIAEKFWKENLNSLGGQLVFDSRFRRLMRSVTRSSGQTKKRLLGQPIEAA